MQQNHDHHRFIDTRETIHDMMDEILVVCPRCSGMARISQERRVVCAACGFARDWSGRSASFDKDGDPMRDSYFGLPLWLQVPCCGHTLWAYNLRHLNRIEAYVRADLREQERDPERGWSNSSLANRLPEWMIVAKHREAVLKAVDRLKAKRAASG